MPKRRRKTRSDKGKARPKVRSKPTKAELIRVKRNVNEARSRRSAGFTRL